MTSQPSHDTLQALLDAQRVAIRSPNPRVALALSQRVDRALQQALTREDLAEGIALRDTIVDLAGLVSTELERLRMELVHHLGTGDGQSVEPRRLNRLVG